MWYVGLDLHPKQATYCVLDEGGRKVKTRTCGGALQSVLAEMRMIKRPFAICYEASASYGVFYDELSEMAERVEVAHPGQLRLIGRATRKNDRFDADKLAKLLAMDMVPRVHVPDRNVRAWRRLIEHRKRLVDERTRSKNAIRSLLGSLAIETPKSLWSKAGVAWLREYEFASELDAVQRDILVERHESLTRMIKRAETVLNRIARDDTRVQLLMTIPGVGVRTAEAVVAYIDDPRRFARNKSVGTYFGLVPCQDASAGKNRFGHITREGPATVRRLLTQSAWQAIRRSPKVRAFFERIQRDDPERKKKALVATAHYLVRVMHTMLRTGEAWRPSAA
jgi:transposase